MAYSTSKLTVERRLELLKPLAEGRSHRWVTAKGRAQNLARQIRESLRIAADHPDDFPDLARAYGTFKIEVPNSSTVQAVLRDRPAVQGEPLNRGEEDDLGEAPGGGGMAFGRPQTRSGLTTAGQVIDAWVKHLPSNDMMHFPETTLPNGELEILYRWAQQRTPRLMIFTPEGSLTLSVAEADAEAYAWKPRPAAPQPEDLRI